VARRVYVAPDEGYARWVEVLHNPGGSSLTASVTHYFALGSDDGTTVVTTTDGDGMITSTDRGWVTDDATDGGSDPAIAVLCGDDGARATISPMHTPGTDSPSIAYSVEVPAQGTVGVVLFVAQRNSRAEAVAWLESFDASSALSDLTHPVANFAGGGRGASFRMAGLLRGGDRDAVELRAGNRLEGTIVERTWTIDTWYGAQSAKHGQVAGVLFGEPGAGEDVLVLRRGEVLVGTLTGEPLVLKLPGGRKLTLPADGISRVGMREPTGEQPQSTDDVAVLRRGDRLQGKILGAEMQIATPYGVVTVPTNRIAGVDLAADDGRLHRITLADGSTLSGTLLDRVVRFRHGNTELELSQDRLAELVVPALLIEPTDDPTSPEVLLTNGDRWSARPTVETLPLATPFGDEEMALGEIRTLCFPRPSLRQVEVVLQDGGAFTARLRADEVSLRLVSGVEVTLAVDFLDEIEVPAQESAAKKGGRRLPMRLGGS